MRKAALPRLLILILPLHRPLFTPAFEAPQVAKFGGDQRSGDRADASDALDRVFPARKEPLNVHIKFDELPG